MAAATTPEYNLEDLRKLKQVGKGAKSRVWLARHEPSESYFALKEISREAIRWKQEADHVWNERRVLTELSQEQPPFPRCCRLHGALKDASALYFLLEFIPGAPLHLHFQAERGFSEARARFYSAELVETLAALHSRGILYRDLKASNVILDARTGRLRLVDFGFAKKLTMPVPSAEGSDSDSATTLRRTHSVCGTEHAMAPEIHLGNADGEATGEGYTMAVDWWSLGVLTFEMLTAKAPFGYRACEGGSQLTIRELAIRSPGSISFPKDIGAEAKALIEQLLEPEPEARLGYSGADEVRQHSWFAGIDWHAVAIERALEPWPDSNPADAASLAGESPPDFDRGLGEFASFEHWDPAQEGNDGDGDPFGDF